MALRCPPARRLVVVAVFVTSAVLLLVTTTFTTRSTTSTTTILVQESGVSAQHNSEAIAATAPLAAPADGCLEGVLTAVADAPLGNQVLQYATAAAVAHRYSLRLALPSSLLKTLSNMFDTLNAERLDWVLQEPPCSLPNVTEQAFLAGDMLPPSTVDDMVMYTRPRRLPVVLTKTTMLAKYMASSMDLLRKEFHFKSSLQEAAKKKLDKIIIDTAKKTKQKKSAVCTVGVDVRRSDDTSEYGMKQEAGTPFYKAAGDAMLRNLKSQCRAVAFVLTCDDGKWCEKQLLPVLNRKATSKTPPSFAFLMSSDNAQDALCLLASCQHTIIAHGSLGLTAAILAGGRTIIYDMGMHDSPDQPVAQHMATLVPDWRLIS